MTTPGSPGRRLEWVEGPVDAIVVKAVELVGTVPGARGFELAYDAADRVLADDEEPRPDEAVIWTARATVRRRYSGTRKPVEHTYEGTATVPAGGRHDAGIVNAVVELLERMGANVVLMADDTPRP